MTLTGTWNYPTAIRFGAGCLAELAATCADCAVARPLLVTDPALAASPMVADALRLCRAAGLPAAVFSAIKSNPTGENVAAGAAAFRAGGHDGVAWIRDLRAEIGIPDGLRDIGIDDDAAERAGALAVADPSAATNPRALTAADYADLFRRAVNGQH